MTPESTEGSRVLEELIRKDRDEDRDEEEPKEHKEVLQDLVISEEEAIDHLVEHARDFQFWVGAGFSASSGIPLAQDIVDEISVKVYEKTNPEDRGEVDAEDIHDWLIRRKWYNEAYSYASALEKEYPSQLLRTKYFEEMLEDKDPSPATYYLTLGVKHDELNPLVWTTNFDDLLEKSFYTIRRTSAIIIESPDEAKLVKDDDHNYVVKVYGDWDEYEPRYFREGATRLHTHVEDLFREQMQGSGLVTVGYSGTEPPAMNLLTELAEGDEEFFEKGLLWGYYGELSDIPDRITELVSKGDFNRKYFRIFEISDADLFMEKLTQRLDLPTIEDELQLSFQYFNVMTYRGMKDRESYVYPELADLGPNQLMDRGFFVDPYEEIYESDYGGMLDSWLKKDEIQQEQREMHRKGLIHCYVQMMDENFEAAAERFTDVEERYDKDEDSSFGKAYALYRLGRYEEAISRLDDAIEFNEEDAEEAQIKQDKRRIEERRVGYYYLQALCAQQQGDHEAEVQFYDRALELTPSRADLWYNRGVALHNLDRLDDEVESYENSVDAQKTFYRAWYNLGIALSEKEEFLRGMKAFEQASETGNELQEAFFNTGRLLGRMGQDTRALENFRTALEIDDHDFEAIYNLGVALLNEKREEEARVAFETYLDEYPDDLDSLNNLGLALHELGLYGEAVEKFDRFLEIDDSHYRVWYNRGFSLVHLERFEDALESYNRSLEINPDTDLVWYRKAALLAKMERYDEAREFFERYLELNEEDDRAWHEYGEVCGALEDYEAQVEAYETALELMPMKRFLHVDLGIALNDRAEHLRKQSETEDGEVSRADELNKQAIEHFDDAERWEEESARLYYERGRAYDAIGQSLRANESYEEAVKLDETHYDAWLNRGINLAHLEQFAKAIDCFEKAIEYKPDLVSAWRNRALAHVHMNEYDRAIEAFEEATQRFPDNARLWRDLAFANAQARNGDEVARALQKAFEHDPSIKQDIKREDVFKPYLNHPELETALN